MGSVIHLILLLAIFEFCVCPPVTKKSTDKQNEEENEVDHLEAMGIEYNRYLKQVVEALEGDADFRRKLENAQEADIRSGKIAEELDFVNHHVRTKLDELKRQELERLRNLAKIAMEKENNEDSPHLKAPEHLDHANPNSFEIADLHKLIKKVTADLEEADKKRRDEFKEYEMQKEFEQKEKMKEMDDEHKKKYEQELEEMKNKHKKHEPLHHPGSKQQLEDVWEKQDHMEQEFDPKTFFYLHDLDGNGFWDQEEVKALFLKELDKLYQAGVPEDDMRERAEEMERMREHVFQETDLDRDGLISFKEFLQQTQKPEFEKDQGWETIDQKPIYTPEEYAEFERRRQEEIQRLIREGKLPPHPPGWAPPPQGMHPGVAHPQYQYQGQGMPQQVPPQGQYGGQHPNSVYQQPHEQQAYHQQQIYQQQQKQQAYQQQQHQAYQQQQQQQQAYHQQQQQAYQQQPQYQQQQGVPPQQPQYQQQQQQGVPPQQFQQGSPQKVNQQGLPQQPQQAQQVPQQPSVPQQQQQQQPPSLAQVPQQPVAQEAQAQQPLPGQVQQQQNINQEPVAQQVPQQQKIGDPNSILPEQPLNVPTVRLASGMPRQPAPK